MKKFIIILISIFSLLSSFAFGFFIKKFVDDKKLYNLEIEKNNLEEKINQFKDINSDSCKFEMKKLKEKINQLEKINFKLSMSANFRNSDDDKKLEKLTDDIFFDKNSLTKDKHSINGWFKVYSSADTDTTTSYVNAVPVYSELNKFSTTCESDVLCRIYIKEFDKDGNILIDEFDGYNHCGNYSTFINGEIYFNTLCKYKE